MGVNLDCFGVLSKMFYMYPITFLKSESFYSKPQVALGFHIKDCEAIFSKTVNDMMILPNPKIVPINIFVPQYATRMNLQEESKGMLEQLQE